MKGPSDSPPNSAGRRRKKKKGRGHRKTEDRPQRHMEKGEKRRGRRERGGFRSPSLSLAPHCGPILLQVAATHSALVFRLLDLVVPPAPIPPHPPTGITSHLQAPEPPPPHQPFYSLTRYLHLLENTLAPFP